MPMEWKEGIIAPIYKKGDLIHCSNYSLNTTYNILSTLIKNRHDKYTNGNLGQNQHGFRKGRSTIDPIHILMQTIEKHCEHAIEIHIVFIGFQQTFDSTIQKHLSRETINMNISAKHKRKYY